MVGPTYRGLRLDGPTEEFHRPVDRLRCDTAPARSTTSQPRSPLIAYQYGLRERPSASL
jgi:hypothetical protein